MTAANSTTSPAARVKATKLHRGPPIEHPLHLVDGAGHVHVGDVGGWRTSALSKPCTSGAIGCEVGDGHAFEPLHRVHHSRSWRASSPAHLAQAGDVASFCTPPMSNSRRSSSFRPRVSAMPSHAHAPASFSVQRPATHLVVGGCCTAVERLNSRVDQLLGTVFGGALSRPTVGRSQPAGGPE